MGVCQTVCGAATSGRGLTGYHIAEAIRKTVMQQQRARDTARAINIASDLKAEDFSEIREVKVEGDEAVSPAPPTTTEPTDEGEQINITDMKVNEYAPEAFRFLRHVESTPDEQFIDEWQLTPERLQLELGEGRSQAFFLKSKTMKFMCKTISAVEVDVLISILKQYCEHLGENKNSLLMRFLMLLSVEANGEVGYILCFSDVFSPCDRLNERWDIKGRTPKPGKYRHFPDKDIALDRHGRDLATSQSQSDAAEEKAPKLVTQKDKDLTRMFWVPLETRKKLVEQLEADFQFLEGNGLMDYSILVGVKYEEDEENLDSTANTKTIEAMRQAFAMGETGLAAAKEVRPASPQPVSANKKDNAGSDYVNGVRSLLGAEIYYIGIIDMLTVYNGKKKSANFFKTFLWKPETLSTIPPDAYRTRIVKYSRRLFPKVVEVDAEGQSELKVQQSDIRE